MIKNLEVLAKTDYQDIYRVTDGVLLVVNKFKPMKIEGVDYPHTYYPNRHNSKSYDKGYQKLLKILTKEYRHEKTWCEPEWSVPSGTVVYSNVPVEIVSKDQWEYQIKTTGEMFSGNLERMTELVRQILQIINGDYND